MEFETALANFQAGARCPVCLDYLKNPVTIYCGHNFCLSCLNVFWKDRTNIFPCPICRFCCLERKFASNPLLGNLTEIAKLLQVRRSKRKGKEEFLCKKHNQILNFFCEKDLEVLCSQCVSSEHQGHNIWPIEQAVPKYRKKLEVCIEPWKERMEQGEKVITMQTRKLLELKKKVEYRREEIRSEFEQFELFLQSERETVLQQLIDEEIDILTKLNENLTKFSDHISTLKNLSKEIESKYVKSDLEFLTKVKRICHRYKSSKAPLPFSFQLKEYGYHLPPQYSGLNIIIKRFQVPVFLDPETANNKLTVSGDRKTVRYGHRVQNLPRNPRRFYNGPAILGSEGYNSGRHYWEVEVNDKLEWILGVCKHNIPRKRRSQNPSIFLQNRLWCIERRGQNDYIAFGPKNIYLVPKVMPSKIGIFLDYELGEVSFYNLSDRSLLYIFNDYFTGVLWPYFYTGTDSKPLKICTVTHSE
ncbi:unnamed protein product [Pipistrellus nathusii]|uniref:Tripartite motif-containing protein 60-like n=1 Tax=Pipistrellus nathusii TaxID=59473 RepID=A0ABP0A5T9_PIPNA